MRELYPNHNDENHPLEDETPNSVASQPTETTSEDQYTGPDVRIDPREAYEELPQWEEAADDDPIGPDWDPDAQDEPDPIPLEEPCPGPDQTTNQTSDDCEVLDEVAEELLAVRFGHSATIAMTAAEATEFGMPVIGPINGKVEPSDPLDKYGPWAYCSGERLIPNQPRIGAEFARDVLVKFDQALRWIEYNAETGRWSLANDAIILRRATEYMLASLASRGLQEMASQIKYDLMEDIIRFAKSHAFVEFKPNCFPGVIHFRNCMLDTNVRPFAEMDFDPKFCSMNQIPYDYDQDATCPRYLAWLDESMDEDDQFLWIRWCGMTITGVNFLQKIMLLDGVGGSSKSQHAKVPQLIIGLENIVEFKTKNLTGRFEMSKLIGKSLLVGSDVSADFLKEASAHVLKALTGEDAISAEVKYRNGTVLLSGEFNVVMISNTKLRVQLEGDLEAWKRRLILINFTNLVENPIPNFAKRIVAEEASGIINLMLDGLRAVRRFGLKLTPAQEARVEDLLGESNSVSKFLQQQLVKDEEGDLTSDELFFAHERYCVRRDWATPSRSVVEKEIARIMRDTYKARERHDMIRGSGAKRGYSGFALAPEPHLGDRE